MITVRAKPDGKGSYCSIILMLPCCIPQLQYRDDIISRGNLAGKVSLYHMAISIELRYIYKTYYTGQHEI